MCVGRRTDFLRYHRDRPERQREPHEARWREGIRLRQRHIPQHDPDLLNDTPVSSSFIDRNSMNDTGVVTVDGGNVSAPLSLMFTCALLSWVMGSVAPGRPAISGPYRSGVRRWPSPQADGLGVAVTRRPSSGSDRRGTDQAGDRLRRHRCPTGGRDGSSAAEEP
jgi:hypothetical protein